MPMSAALGMLGPLIFGLEVGFLMGFLSRRVLGQYDLCLPRGDLSRLCALMADGRLDGQVELEASWREASRAFDALLERRIGGKAVLHVD